MTTSFGGERRITREGLYAIRDLTQKFVRDKRESEETLLRVALAEAYQLGFEAGFNSQKEIANGFPQA